MKTYELFAFVLIVTLFIAEIYFMLVGFGESCYYGHAKTTSGPLFYCLISQVGLIAPIIFTNNKNKKEND